MLMAMYIFILIFTLKFTDSVEESDSQLPVLIWWTERVFPHWESEETVISCEIGKCLTTKSRKNRHVDEDTLVTFMFYGTDVEVEDLPLFSRRRKRTSDRTSMWALLHEESPMNNYVFSHEPMIHLFNFTSTFSRNSDYPLTTLFLPDLEYLIERRPVLLDLKNDLRSKGTASILYVQSHCDVASDRDRYVAELSRYVRIDSFGSCLRNGDLPIELNTTEQFQDESFYDFVAKYKFHLAFENAICNDYVTEKLFRALHVGSVPIYRGSPSVRDWVPRSSVILVDDFSSPKELADFVMQIDADDEAYLGYLRFKSERRVSNANLFQHLRSRPWGVNDDLKVDFIRGFECFVCDKMVEIQRRSKTNDSKPVHVANNSHMGCPPPDVSVSDSNTLKSRDTSDLMEWIDNYWYGLDIANALHRMIANEEQDSNRIHFYATNTEKDEL